MKFVEKTNLHCPIHLIHHNLLYARQQWRFDVLDSGPTRIGIQPFGNVSQSEVDSVKLAIEKMYEFEVVVLDNHQLPDMAYTEIRYPRYRADSLVEWISQRVPDSVDMVLGLTNKDISITKYKDRQKD